MIIPAQTTSAATPSVKDFLAPDKIVTTRVLSNKYVRTSNNYPDSSNSDSDSDSKPGTNTRSNNQRQLLERSTALTRFKFNIVTSPRGIEFAPGKYTADGIQTDGLAVPYGFDGSSLLANATLPTTLGGLKISVTDSTGMKYKAGIYSVSPTMVNWLIASQVSDGSATVTFTQSEKEILVKTINVARISPALFTVNATGSGTPTAMILRIKDDSTRTLEPFSGSIDIGNPKDEVYLVLCGTGFRHFDTPANIIANIGAENAPIYYSGAVPNHPGLDQINLLIPRSLKGAGKVLVNISFGRASVNTVHVKIK